MIYLELFQQDLFTGWGYHVYQPIDLPVLEEESIFRFFDNPSTEFIRYAAQRWTDGKNDACNKPSIKSCLLRVPGSINSKNNKIVEIVQDWNGKRLEANKLLQDFYIKSAGKKLVCRSKQREGGYVYDYHSTTLPLHYRYPVAAMCSTTITTTTVSNGIAWIDTILGNGGMSDYRKILIDLVIVPYLVNIKQCDFDDAYNTAIKWLDKCGQKRKLDFNARFKVRYALNRSRQNGIRPMRLDTMKENYSEIYNEVIMK